MVKVVFKRVLKILPKLPSPIRTKLIIWAQQVELLGLAEVRKSPGWHDEPLKGKRQGQRSIRLSRSYRAIYFELGTEEQLLIVLVEVNKHEY